MTDESQDRIPGFKPLYLTTRNGHVESVHYGAIAIVTPDGELLAAAGDPHSSTFMRSSAKPFQSIPLVEMEGLTRYQISDEELALMSASHSGTDHHIEVLSKLQAKIGVTESDLLCGTHLPFDKASRTKLIESGSSPTPNHHNCSGKHTGMLAATALLGVSTEFYTETSHPLQKCILSVLAEMSGLEESKIQLGRDGCSVPTFSMPLYHAAWAWAALTDPSKLSPGRADACRRITKAMASHPFYVAGPGRLDTRLMETVPDKLISKAGAEAFQAIGVRPDAIQPGSPALGIGLKISDGDLGKRARRAVTLEVLRQLGVLTESELQNLADLGPIQLNHNQAGIITGESRPCFQLQYN